MYLGIDFGSTTTKIVLMDNNKIIEKYRIEREDSYEDIIRALDTSKIHKIMAVGTGASYLDGDICGIPTIKVDEFEAVALGGYYLSGLEECMVVSLGTGTSFVYVNNDKHEYTGGTGIGGALLSSYAKLAHYDDVNEFMEIASSGDINNSDLLIKDISKIDIKGMPGDVTVANMAKIDTESRMEDYAFGACNLVFQNVGVMAVLADRAYMSKKVVVMGSIGQSKIAKTCFDAVGNLFGYEFIIPEDAVYGVAAGAILYGDENYRNRFNIYGIPMDEATDIFE